MAGLRKLRGKYYARIRLKGGKEKLIPLDTNLQRQAEKRIKFINEKEWYLKIGWEKELNLDPLPTVGVAVKIFLDECTNKGLAKTTVDHYGFALDQFQKVIRSSWRVDLITENRCNDLVAYLTNNYEDTSVNSYLKSINTFMNWLRKKYKIELPPKIKEIPIERKLPEFLTPEELDRIYALCDDAKMLATFKVYAETGIRLRELHNCVLDAKLSGNYVKLQQTKGKRERIVPIPPEIVNDFKLAKFAPYKHDPNKCEPYKPNYISKTFTKLRRKAGIKGKSIHSLRHTFALRKLLELGNIYLVSQLLGHQDVKTTQVYLEFPNGYIKDVFSDWLPTAQNRLQNVAETGARA